LKKTGAKSARAAHAGGEGGGAKGGLANRNLQGDKKFVDGGGGVIVVHRGPKSIIGPGAPYFTELAWTAPVILRRGESSVLSFDLWQLALKTTRTTNK
jgi:hypothetical protein